MKQHPCCHRKDHMRKLELHSYYQTSQDKQQSDLYRMVTYQLISKNLNHENKIHLKNANVHPMSFLDAIQFSSNLFFIIWGLGV